MNEKRFFTKINKNGRNVIIDKECHIELIDLTMVCDVLNRLDLKLKHYNEVNGEQQATISALKEENEQLRRLFEEMKQPITINLTEEDEKELRKLLGLIDDE